MIARPIIALILAAPAFGFTTSNRFVATERFASASSSLQAANRAELATKEFQLEELEDREECETVLWLNEDGTVTMGQSNGPKVKEYQGEWHVLETASEEDKPFRMTLKRSYEAGSHTGKNQAGEIDYEVKREFWGNIEMVGGSVSVSGKMHGIDEQSLLDCELGYFTLIDAVASDGFEGEKN